MKLHVTCQPAPVPRLPRLLRRKPCKPLLENPLLTKPLLVVLMSKPRRFRRNNRTRRRPPWRKGFLTADVRRWRTRRRLIDHHLSFSQFMTKIDDYAVMPLLLKVYWERLVVLNSVINNMREDIALVVFKITRHRSLGDACLIGGGSYRRKRSCRTVLQLKRRLTGCTTTLEYRSTAVEALPVPGTTVGGANQGPNGQQKVTICS